MLLVNQIRTSVANTVPPMIGRSHPGRPCVRTTRTLTVKTPKKKHPSSEWTSTRVSVDWNPSAQRHWYATGRGRPNATIPVRRCAAPSPGARPWGTWILSYMRNASRTCTAARNTAAVANHTLRLSVSEKNRVEAFPPVGSCTLPYTPRATETAPPASTMPSNFRGTEARATGCAVGAVMPAPSRSGADILTCASAANKGERVRLDDMILVSVDDHAVEPPHMFDGRRPTQYVDVAPRVVRKDDGSDVWVYEGREIPNIGLNAVAGRPPEEYGMEPTSFDEIRDGCYDIHQRIRDMDANGVLGSLCFPSFPNL